MVTIGNTAIVCTQNGDVFGHEVTNHDIGPAFKFTGAKAAFNPQDRFVVTIGNLLIVTTQNGDVFGHAQVVAWGCAGGQLQLTLLPKATNDVSVALDGTQMLHAHIAGLEFWNGAVSVPPTHQGPCVFTITGGELLGSTRVQFEPR